jgi:hypothetical protein
METYILKLPAGEETMSRIPIFESLSKLKSEITAVEEAECLQYGFSTLIKLCVKSSFHISTHILQKLKGYVQWKNPTNRNSFLNFNNAPAHSALSVQKYLARNHMTVVHQPLYSLDLTPCDSFLFPKYPSRKDLIMSSRSKKN